MTRRFSSQAEYYRHHRKVFLLALELGVTPAEAEQEMLRIEQRERHRALMELRGKSTRQPAHQPGAQGRSFMQWDAPWMARD